MEAVAEGQGHNFSSFTHLLQEAAQLLAVLVVWNIWLEANIRRSQSNTFWSSLDYCCSDAVSTVRYEISNYSLCGDMIFNYSCGQFDTFPSTSLTVAYSQICL